jgi:hypothetical protein
MKYDYIGTYTNKKYHFLNPSVSEVCIEDISQALSMNCRYSGHVKSFYSVAEHSCIIFDLALKETGDLIEAYSGLMHDASEAYLTDVPRPIKPHLEGYSDIEQKAEKIIQDAFNFTPMSNYIKYVDTHICGIEAKQLFQVTPSWADDFDHIDIQVKGWMPDQAKREFMDRFIMVNTALKVDVLI